MLGLAMPPRVFVGYIYCMEFLPMDKTSKVTAILMGNDGFVMIISALWFMSISKNWRTLFTLATCMVVVVFIIQIFMPESPKFLVSKGRYAEARAVMTRIAKSNGLTSFAFNEEEAKCFGLASQSQEDGGNEITYECKWIEEVE